MRIWVEFSFQTWSAGVLLDSFSFETVTNSLFGFNFHVIYPSPELEPRRRTCSQRLGWDAGSKRQALVFYLSVRICCMFSTSQCRGQWDPDLCTLPDLKRTEHRCDMAKSDKLCSQIRFFHQSVTVRRKNMQMEVIEWEWRSFNVTWLNVTYIQCDVYSMWPTFNLTYRDRPGKRDLQTRPFVSRCHV